MPDAKAAWLVRFNINIWKLGSDSLTKITVAAGRIGCTGLDIISHATIIYQFGRGNPEILVGDGKTHLG